MVTPSLVIVGAPYFLSMTTLRPSGPRVTLTASASLLTPRSSARRAESSNCRVLAMCADVLRRCRSSGGGALPRRQRPGRPDGILSGRPGRCLLLRCVGQVLLLDDREHVAGREDEVVLAIVLDLGTAVLAVDHGVADADVERHARTVLETARANGKDSPLLGLLLGGVRDHEARRGGLLGVGRLDHDAVLERLDGNLGGRRHVLTPSRLGVPRYGARDVALRRRGDRTALSLPGTFMSRVPVRI